MMNELPEALFLNPVWHALRGPHRHLALGEGSACRYPGDVAPFAATGVADGRALAELRSLLAPGESVWIFGSGQNAPGLQTVDRLDCVQMVLPADVELPRRTGGVQTLTAVHASEMVALTDVAFPGFFRSRTYRMGSYCGVRVDGELVAMGGERLRLDGYPELSGICTHPAHRGNGFARIVVDHLVRCHRRDGLRSWLHVGAANTHAIDFYTFLGFRPVRTLTLHRIERSG